MSQKIVSQDIIEGNTVPTLFSQNIVQLWSSQTKNDQIPIRNTESRLWLTTKEKEMHVFPTVNI